MSRRQPRVALAIAATAGVLVTGCGTSDSADAPGSRDAKAALVKADTAARKALSRSSIGQPTSTWKPVVAAVSDPTCDTGNDEEDGYRWRSAATLQIADKGTDGDGIVSVVMGSLAETFHGVSNGPSRVGDLDDDPIVLLPVTYGSGPDAVSVDVTIQRAAQGWTFLVAGRTACLTPG